MHKKRHLYCQCIQWAKK